MCIRDRLEAVAGNYYPCTDDGSYGHAGMVTTMVEELVNLSLIHIQMCIRDRHFTGDFHAITSANNLLAAMLDNHIQQGNTLGIDPRQVVWKRCVDMNDRVLRNIVVGLGRKTDGMVREDHFVITVASEIMAILCLADDLADLKRRLGRIIVAYNFKGEPVTADDLQATGAMAALLKDAIKPNLIQTLEHTPALVHGGPFANIAHGCNSVRATKMALKLSDITVTAVSYTHLHTICLLTQSVKWV